MKALKFINKKLRSGDKVRLRMKGAKKAITGYFGGYKMYDGIQPDLDYGIYPIFYREGKDGRMVRRSIFGDNHSTAVCISDIQSVKKIRELYRHIGYFNNAEDNERLSVPLRYQQALKAYKKGKGTFVGADNDEVFDDIEEDDDTMILEDGKYAVRFYDVPAVWNDETRKSPGYIDIFERIN